MLTRISAVAFIHHFRNLVDNTQSFLVRKALRGYKNSFHRSDSRKPITQQLLLTLCHNVSYVVINAYQLLMFKAMFLLAFHAFLRISE